MKWIHMLLYKFQLRGKYLPDFCHRIHNDAMVAVKQLGLHGAPFASSFADGTACHLLSFVQSVKDFLIGASCFASACRCAVLLAWTYTRLSGMQSPCDEHQPQAFWKRRVSA